MSAVTDPANNRLYVFLLHILRPGTVIGTRVARFKLSTLQLLGVSSSDLAGTSTTTPYGSTAFKDGGFAYMYSSNDGHIKVALRAPLATVESQSTWQYWVDDGADPESDHDDTWSAAGNHAAAVDMPFTMTVEEDLTTLSFGAPIAPVAARRAVRRRLPRHRDARRRVPHPPITFTAPTPQGPWSYASDLPETPADLRSYGAADAVRAPGCAATHADPQHQRRGGSPADDVQLRVPLRRRHAAGSVRRDHRDGGAGDVAQHGAVHDDVHEHVDVQHLVQHLVEHDLDALGINR